MAGIRKAWVNQDILKNNYYNLVKAAVTALDLEEKQKLIKDKDEQKFYNQMCKLFKPLETPKPGDWLSGSKEAHQSFSNYRLPFYNPVTPERNIIYLQ